MLTLLTTLLAAQAVAPTLDEVLGEQPAAPTCSVTLLVDVDEAGKERQVSEYRYDAPSDAWSLIAYNGGPPPEDELEEFEREGRDGGDRSDEQPPPAAFYAESVSHAGLDWTRSTAPDEDGLSLWQIDELPKGTVVANGRDVSRLIRLRYLVQEGEGAPRVRIAAGQLKERWRIPLIARIDRFAIVRRYAPAAPETGAPGAMLPIHEQLEIVANILGRERSALIETTYEGWDCMPAEGALSASTASAR